MQSSRITTVIPVSGSKIDMNITWARGGSIFGAGTDTEKVIIRIIAFIVSPSFREFLGLPHTKPWAWRNVKKSIPLAPPSVRECTPGDLAGGACGIDLRRIVRRLRLTARSWATGVRGHDDDTRSLGESHPRVQQADDPVFDDAYDGDGMPRAEMRLEREQHLPGDGGRDRQQRFCGHLLIQGLAMVAAGVQLWRGHTNLSVGGDNENWRVVDFPEHVRVFVVFPVVPPNYPNAASGRRFGQHPKRAIPPVIDADDPLESGLNLLGRELTITHNSGCASFTWASSEWSMQSLLGFFLCPKGAVVNSQG